MRRDLTGVPKIVVGRSKETVEEIFWEEAVTQARAELALAVAGRRLHA